MMRWVESRILTVAATGLFGAALMLVGIQHARGQERAEDDQSLTYSRGQTVFPAYDGYHPNSDGTIDLYFGYLNQNYEEQLDIPVGPDNNIGPAPWGPDAGQPTHFLPRGNYYVFAIRVAKDFGSKEIVWTLTSHGKTQYAYASLRPAYLKDDMGMQRDFFGTPPPGNKPPALTVEGDKQRTVHVGERVTLTAIATDDTPTREQRGSVRGGNTAGAGAEGGNAAGGNGAAGGNANAANVRRAGGGFAKGLRLVWFVYRGTNDVTFDPWQFKAYEDRRGGSPWAPTWVNPPIPPDNKWIVQAVFRKAGTYVLRCQTTDGYWFTNENVTFNVVP